MNPFEFSEFRKLSARDQLKMLIDQGLEDGEFKMIPGKNPSLKRSNRIPWVIDGPTGLAVNLKEWFYKYHPRRANAQNPVSSFKKNIENWLRDDGPVISVKFWAPLAEVFFGDNDRWAPFRESFLSALQASWDKRHEFGDDELYGRQILTGVQLRKVYDFDDYHEDDGSGVENISFELFQAWYQAYSTGFLYHCPSKKSEISAVTGFFPVSDEWADDFLARKVNEDQLSGKIIGDAYQDQPCLTWYYSGLSAKEATKVKGIRSYLPKIVGYSLIVWARRESPSIGRQRIRIVSEGATTIGERILERWFKVPAAGKPAASNKEQPRFQIFVTLEQIKNLLLTDRHFPDTEEFRNQVRTAFSRG